MRVNKFVAQATGLSRRAADQLVAEGRVAVNQRPAQPGGEVTANDQVTLDKRPIAVNAKTLTVIFNKPAGYVCSRRGQGSRTIYDLLPAEYGRLKPAGRLDKDSDGLLLLTDDGGLANQLTHPRYAKTKVYQLRLDKPLQPLHHQMINDNGVQLDDGPSRLALQKLDDNGRRWQATMSEGRNRQIRRTFNALGYEVKSLRRTAFGDYRLDGLKPGQYQELTND